MLNIAHDIEIFGISSFQDFSVTRMVADCKHLNPHTSRVVAPSMIYIFDDIVPAQIANGCFREAPVGSISSASWSVVRPGFRNVHG